MIRTFGLEQLRSLSAAARDHSRRRLNLNIHRDLADPVQRFFNAMEPGSYVRPHRHPGARFELFVALAGRAAVLTFDTRGTVAARCELSAEGPELAVEIPAGAVHTVAALSEGTLLLEIKPGPYHPLEDKDFASWAPPENDPRCAAVERWYRLAHVGDRPPPG